MADRILYTLDEAAVAMSVSKDTVRRLVDRGALAFVTLPGVRGYRLAVTDIERLVTRNRVPARR